VKAGGTGVTDANFDPTTNSAFSVVPRVIGEKLETFAQMFPDCLPTKYANKAAETTEITAMTDAAEKLKA